MKCSVWSCSAKKRIGGASWSFRPATMVFRMRWTRSRCPQFLHVHRTHECDLYQLNALATCLGQMNGREKTAFEGLFNMEVSKKYGPISVATMINLAYSTDCCHVINATPDEPDLKKAAFSQAAVMSRSTPS